MTGPPYPRWSNAIGDFVIGVSPIGTPAYDEWATTISQYANSPKLDALVTSFAAAMNQQSNIQNFYDLVWNITTAQGYGLDVWGRIVGVGRALAFPGGSSFLGFGEAGSSWTGFGQGGFFSGSGSSSNFLLSDADFRTLILAKAAGNISDGSIPAVNKILMALFPGRGDAYVADGLNMSLTYTFSFALNPVELAIIEQSDVLPNPAGVVINIAQP